MKVLIVGWGYPPNIDGGLDIAVKELFQGLRKRESMDVELILPEERAPVSEEVIGVEVEGDMFSKSEDLSREVASIAQDYDIVHTHDWFGAEAGFKSQKYSGVKWVSTFHSISSSRSRKPSKKIEKLEKIGLNFSDISTAVSNKLGDEIKSEYGKKPQTIYNGFSELAETQTDITLDYDRPIFLFIGRHSEQKGVEHLIYGFKKFLEDDSEGSLIIGGDGHMKESLEDFVKMLNLEENVFFEGFIPSEELYTYYQNADIFVSPSINEPFGLTISEALTQGTKVVCTESGINELLDNDSVTLVEANSDSIKRGLEKSLEKPNPKIEKYEWSNMVDEYVELYKSLV